jgi:predicted nucleotidyltransferase
MRQKARPDPVFVDPVAEALARICREHGVHRLEIFGSAVTDQFDPVRSDIDFIVDFGADAQPQLFAHYFGLKQALEALFGRQVDLVMAGAMRNPHFIEAAARTRRVVYASPVAEAA